MERSQESEWTATSASQSRRFMPSRAKLIPSAGSGNSVGTSSARSATSHASFAYPYRHRFSFSPPHTTPNPKQSHRNSPGTRNGSRRDREATAVRTHLDRTLRRNPRRRG
uniref:Uncharacterized protein n=1 Tax=Arundo donax TaxID=35708 RepID=A0A0A9F9Y4_ARUDO